MCGGPVISADNSCVGILEGIVPVLEQVPEVETLASKLAGSAVFIDVEQVQELLGLVENAHAVPSDSQTWSP